MAGIFEIGMFNFAIVEDERSLQQLCNSDNKKVSHFELTHQILVVLRPKRSVVSAAIIATALISTAVCSRLGRACTV